MDWNEFTSYDDWNQIEREVFEYLDELREGGVGVTNMLGAAPYVEDEFCIEAREARKIISKWIRALGKQHKGGDSSA